MPSIKVSERDLLGKEEAEPDDAEPAVGDAAVPIRHSAAPRAEVPATAAQHAVGAT